MGTRSITNIIEDGKTLLTIYRQYDGYPTGMGADIQNVLKGRAIVNGYNDPENQCNGMGCAAAMLIAGLKDGCGNVYIYPADSADVGEDYIYNLSVSDGVLQMQILDAWDKKELYSGPLDDMDPEKAEG